jgi:DNA-binding FadR family transcriptional regulator
VATTLALHPDEGRTRAWIDRPYYHAVADETPDDMRLGVYTAAAIEDALSAGPWPTGRVCGPDEVLAANFNVGIRPLRQAFRLLEQRGLCRAQRGVSGGFVILQPNLAEVARSMSRHLVALGVTYRHIWELRRFMEPAVIEAHASHKGWLNPIFELAMACLNLFPSGLDLNLKAEVADRSGLVRASERADAREPLQVWRQSFSDRQALFDLDARAASGEGPRPVEFRNRAAAVAARICADTRTHQIRNQDRIGSAATLSERYAVGLPVMVEAIRLLEDAGLVISLRGRGGGIAVAEPSDASLIRATFGYFAATDTTLEQCGEASRLLNAAAVTLAAERVARGQPFRFNPQPVFPTGVDGTPSMLQWFRLLQQIYDFADNPMMHSLVRCTVGYDVRRTAQAYTIMRRSQIGQRLESGARSLVAAIQAGQVTEASRQFDACQELLL